MSEIKQIENRIKVLKDSLDNVKGTETEVYTRIVGYYRQVKNFNVGQDAARKQRVNFKLKEGV